MTCCLSLRGGIGSRHGHPPDDQRLPLGSRNDGQVHGHAVSRIDQLVLAVGEVQSCRPIRGACLMGRIGDLWSTYALWTVMLAVRLNSVGPCG